MKVILNQDVAKLGRRYDLVDVPNGRALNMLIPQGLAMAATPENRKKIKAHSDKIASERAAAASAFAAAAEQIDGETVTVPVKANPKGHLFEALKEEMVADALQAKGVAITSSHVVLGQPIKELGTHEITLSDGDERITLTIEVVPA